MSFFPAYQLLRTPARIFWMLFLVISLGNALTQDFTAEAAKPKAVAVDPAAGGDADLKKMLDPITVDLLKMLSSVDARALLSPTDEAKLVDIKFKLMDAMDQAPTNVLLVKPVYLAGLLFANRESFNDAHDLFGFLATGFPTNSYGLKAKVQMQQMEKQLGADYFGIAAAPVTATAGAPGTPASTPAAVAPVKK